MITPKRPIILSRIHDKDVAGATLDKNVGWYYIQLPPIPAKGK